ncbi:Regulatory protein AtoC [Planktothrix tepida]|uniref:Response regulator receiver domain protein (CheY) n=1 Tax=Planktothrix tepida PCC 9214 TaxID=671072 RepID=A0A1J1LLL9_9CYAN|nr:response regulator [Planktothrix tepida]CAD5936349.1 Regulatory protein AtoC [Planktothrix tepida]CUR33408.1 Response regulator receiver domain protein (CheY) [Planktothrix tepida PCC 9214]
MNNQNTRTRKVVIADDDIDSRTMLALILADEGWEVKEAQDGKEAIEITIKEQPDLLILDNRMPELTGVEVYQQLQLAGIKQTVVLATGYGDLKELALSMGITHFISKPFDILELLQIIESAYESSRQ